MLRPIHLLTACIVLASITAIPTNAAATRVALLASDDHDSRIAGILSLAETELTGQANIALVERGQIERVVREQQLSRTGLIDSDHAVRVGQILAADVLASVEADTNAKAIGLIVFDASTGIRLLDEAVTAPSDSELGKLIANRIALALGKRQHLNTLRTVCLVTVRNADLPRDMDGLCDAIGRLVERTLVRSPGVALMERGRLDAVTRERALSDEAARRQLLASLVMIELEIGRDGRGLRATAILTDWTGKRIGKPITSAGAVDAAALAVALAADLSRQTDFPPAATLPQPLSEAARFAHEAALRANADDAMRAVPAAEAAHALSPTEPFYAALLCRCLADYGYQIYEGPHGRRPLGTPMSWPDRQSPPPPLQRAAEILAELRLPQDGARADIRAMADGAFQQVSRFTGRATADAVLHGQPTPLPPPDLAEIKHHVREYLLAADMRLSAGVHDLNSFSAYCRHFAALVNDDEWICSCSPADWTAELDQLVDRWMAVRAKWPDFQALAVSQAMEAVSVGWQFQSSTHGGVMVYGLGQSRSRRWDPGPDDLARLESARQALARDRSPLARWHVQLMSLSIAAITTPPQTLKQKIGAFIEQMEKKEAVPEYDSQNEMRFAQYNLMTDANRLLAHTTAAEAYTQQIFDYALSRHELVNFVFAGGVHPGFPTGPIDETERKRQITAIERILKVLDAPDVKAVCGIPDKERDYYRLELAKLREPANPLAGQPLASAPGAMRRLIDFFDDDQGLQFSLRPIPQGRWVYLLRPTRRSSNEPLEAQLVRIPLAGGPPELLGSLATSITRPPNQPRQWRSTTRYKLDTAACLDDEVYCVATASSGILIFPTTARAPIHLDAGDGLPSAHGTAVAVLKGRVYAAVGTYPTDGYLISFDLATRKVDVLASFRRKQKLSPFDDGTAFAIPGMVADPARHRLIVAIQRFEPEQQINGLWEFRPDTGKWTQLMPMRLQLLENSHVGGILTRIMSLGRVSDDAVPVATSTGLFLFDLKSDKPANLFQRDIGLHDLPLPRNSAAVDWSTLAGQKAAMSEWMAISDTFAITKPWVWTPMRGGSWGRTNLTTGQTQVFPSPRADAYAFRPDYIESVPGGNQMLVGDEYGLWAMTIPPSNAVPSGRERLAPAIPKGLSRPK
jgi:hypothetical protein